MILIIHFIVVWIPIFFDSMIINNISNNLFYVILVINIYCYILFNYLYFKNIIKSILLGILYFLIWGIISYSSLYLFIYFIVDFDI